MKRIILALSFVALAACGGVDGKPLNPDPNGGPVNSANSGFPNTGTGTNNQVANNESTNNVIIVNGEPNVGTNNVDPANNVATCGDDVRAEPLGGFESEPTFESGIVVDLQSDFMVVENDFDQALFVAEGLDLTDYFFIEEQVFVQREELATGSIDRVFSQSSVIEFGRVLNSDVGESPSLTIESNGYALEFAEQFEAETCTENSECGLRERIYSTHTVQFFSDFGEAIVEPFQVINVEQAEVYVTDSSSYTYAGVSNDTCAESGFFDASLSFFVGVTSPN